MTFEKLWASYTARHPQLRDEENKVQIPVHQLKEALRLAHEEGKSEARGHDLFKGLFR